MNKIFEENQYIHLDMCKLPDALLLYNLHLEHRHEELHMGWYIFLIGMQYSLDSHYQIDIHSQLEEV